MNNDTQVIIEALSIEDDYAKNWKEIDKDLFDKVILLDPKTDIEKNVIGFVSKQLILPKLKNGEDISDIEDDITTAINNYITHRPEWPAQLKNVANFPTIHNFVDYAINGDESEFAKAFTNGDISIDQKAKANPIEEIYNKYYKEIPKNIFDKIIAADPDTNEKSIGSVAKNLLLPKYLKGESKIIQDNLSKLSNIIKEYKKGYNELNSSHKDITQFKSVEEFIEIALKGEESELLKYLKKCPEWKNIRYLGSTKKYDIFEPLTFQAQAWIAGADKKVGGPGISSDRGSESYKQNKYGHWCTTQIHHWDTYRNLKGEHVIYYNLMAKGKNLTADEREHNYQIAISQSGKLRQDADGYEHWGGSGEHMRDAFAEDPEILRILSQEEDFGGLIPEVLDYVLIQNYQGKPFEYNEASYKELINNPRYQSIKSFIQSINVDENTETINSTAFMDWTAVEEVNMPDTLKKIEAQAFKNCSSLKLNQLPSQLEYIGGQAFQNCSNMSGTLRLPNSLTYIGTQAFANTGDLTLKISGNRTQKLKINTPNESDKKWYSRHLKMLNVQESLNEDKEIELDEALPRDLAQAYINSSHQANQRHPWGGQNHLSNNSYYRGEAAIDFANATYTVITPQQAVEYLGMNVTVVPSDENDENSKYNISTRISGANRAAFNQKLCNLRFLIDNQVIEYDVHDGSNVLYQPFYCNIPSTKFGRYPYFKAGSRTTTNSYYAVKYSDLYTIIQIADKIYLTNEYEVRRTNHRSDVRQDIRIPGVEDTVKIIPGNLWDTGNHSHPRVRYSAANIYSHSHDDAFNKTIDEYNEYIMKKSSLYNSYNVLRRAVKNLEKNSDAYDEDEYNEIHDHYTQEYQKIVKRYNLLSQQIKALRNTLAEAFDEEFIQRYEEEKQRLIELQANITKNTELLSKYRNAILINTRTSIKDEHQKLIQEVELKRSEYAQQESEISSLNSRNAEIQEAIAKLQAEMSQNTSKVEELTSDLTNKAAAIQNAQNEVDKGAEAIANRIAAEGDALERKLREIEDWLDANDPQNKDKWKNKRPNETPLPDNVSNMVDFTNDDENSITLDDNDSVCVSKFGLSFNELKTILNKYDDYAQKRNLDINGFTNPLMRDDNLWFNSMNDMYEYWRQIKYKNVSDMDNIIKQMIEVVKTERL